MKIATADAQFNDLKGANRVVARAKASRADLAAARAVRNLFRDPKVRRKHIQMFNVTISLFEEKTVEVPIS